MRTANLFREVCSVWLAQVNRQTVTVVADPTGYMPIITKRTGVSDHGYTRSLVAQRVDGI